MIGMAIIPVIKNRQLRSKNGIENGNSGIEHIAGITKVAISKAKITNPIKINHDEKAIMDIWNIHVPNPGIIANIPEIITHIAITINPIINTIVSMA